MRHRVTAISDAHFVRAGGVGRLGLSHMSRKVESQRLNQEKWLTERSTEWLPVARPMRTRCARCASVAPRVAIGDRGR